LSGRGQSVDRRAELFRADERMLDSAAATGDVQLSQTILAALPVIPVEGKDAAPYHVATRRNGDAVLVLVKAPALKSYKDNVREALVRQIADILRADEQLKEKRTYIGIKGRLTYGAIQTPPNVLQIGSVIPEEKLYDFYGEPAVPANVTLAGSQLGEKEHLQMNVPVQRADSGDVLDDSHVAANEFPRKANEDDAEVVKTPEDKVVLRAKEDKSEGTKPAAPTAGGAEGAALTEKVRGILEANCYRCHGQDGANEGGFNFVLNLEKLARTVVKPKSPAGSLLYKRLSATDEDVMPPEGEIPRPSAADIAVVRSWIEAGAPAPEVTKPRDFITNDSVVKTILADVRQVSERSRRFQRYFTLTHLYNAGVSEDELQTFRNAFTKLVNSLSWNTSLLIPQAIDAAKTVFRVDIRQLNWSNEIWEKIEGANPYFLALATPDALACNDLTQSKMPYVRIDWFVFAASKPPLYHSVLAVPGSDRELEQMLHVNVAANIEQEQAIRAAFNRSGVSQHNRLIEWHKSSYGSYWKSYDFGGSTGRQNLFEHPLGPGSESSAFRHDGGEIIFTLPNGLQGYLLVDGSGKRIDQGPTSIVTDPKQLDRTVTNGVSCMSCHYTGTIPKTDEVGAAVRANPKAFKNSADILALYRDPKELGAVLDEDAKRFAGALGKIGISSLSRSGEPVSAMALRFQQELDLRTAACEFGLTTQEFERRLDSADTTARALAPLRIAGGTIKRESFVSVFGDAAVEFRLIASIGANATPVKPSRNSAGTAPKRSKADDGKPGEFRRFTEMRWGVKSLAFSPTAGLLAAGKPDQALTLFDIANDARLGGLDKLQMLKSVTSCLFTPDGSHLLAGGSTGHIQLYEVSKEGLLTESAQFAGHSKEVSCMAVSGDGKLAVSGGKEKTLRFWEVETGRELASFPGCEGPIKACFIAKNGRAALATDGATLLAIDLKKKQVTRRRQLAGSWSSGQAAAFSSDGEQVAAGDGNTVRLWDVNSGRERPKLEDNEIQWSMAFTPDGTRLISGGNGKVNIWDVRKHRKIHALSVAGNGYIQSLAVSPDNKHLAAIPSSAGQDLQIFRLGAAED
jgi:mono/diheme cytochrome c family protein